MPEVTFLLSVNTDAIDPTTLAADADEISDLVSSSFEVLSCKPWARPTLGAAAPAGGFTSLNPFNGNPPSSAPTA